jgi:hypothetical protein
VGIIGLQHPTANGRKLPMDLGVGELPKPLTAMGRENEELATREKGYNAKRAHISETPLVQQMYGFAMQVPLRLPDQLARQPSRNSRTPARSRRSSSAGDSRPTSKASMRGMPTTRIAKCSAIILGSLRAMAPRST